MPFKIAKISTSGGARTRDGKVSRPVLNQLNYVVLVIVYSNIDPLWFVSG